MGLGEDKLIISLLAVEHRLTSFS